MVVQLNCVKPNITYSRNWLFINNKYICKHFIHVFEVSITNNNTKNENEFILIKCIIPIRHRPYQVPILPN